MEYFKHKRLFFFTVFLIFWASCPDVNGASTTQPSSPTASSSADTTTATTLAPTAAPTSPTTAPTSPTAAPTSPTAAPTSPTTTSKAQTTVTNAPTTASSVSRTVQNAQQNSTPTATSNPAKDTDTSTATPNINIASSESITISATTATEYTDTAETSFTSTTGSPQVFIVQNSTIDLNLNVTSETTTPILDKGTTEIDNCAGVNCGNNGTCRNIDNNFTCDCIPGWNGTNCTEDVQECDDSETNCVHGQCKELPGSYECHCGSGWMGPKCDTDVPECQNNSNCVYGLCSERHGSYYCFCNSGWKGEHCNIAVNHCKESTCASKSNSYCNNTEDSFECICNENFKDVDNVCQRQVLWLGYKDFQDPALSIFDTCKVQTPVPFPYFESLYTSISVQSNGYVNFDDQFSYLYQAPVKFMWPYGDLLGVYWSPRDFERSKRYIGKDATRLKNITYESPLIKYVKEIVNSSTFEPLYALVSTWENDVPKNFSSHPNNKAVFQLVLATDGDVSYAIRNYQTLWPNTDLSNQPYVSTTYSSGDIVWSNTSTPIGNGTTDILELWTGSPKRNKNFECVQKTQEIVASLQSNNESLPPCPCYLIEAMSDKQFEILSDTCYKRNVSEGLQQQCCYNRYGLLITNSKEAGVPIDTSNSWGNAHDLCCGNGSRLCDWFYEQIPSSKCSSSKNESEVPKFVQHIIPYRVRNFLSLKLEATNNETAKFYLEHTFKSINGIHLDNNTFSWNISEDLKELRKQLAYPQNINFYVTNAQNISDEFGPTIYLCLCSKSDQCFDGWDFYWEAGKVFTLGCDCNGLAKGQFCEQEIEDPCNQCFNKNKSACHTAEVLTCPSCPDGYDGDRILCRDIDECADNNGGCEQICKNTEGKYECLCSQGFKLDEGKCVDINECEENNDFCNDATKYCINLVGSATCRCPPGLLGDEHTKCFRALYAYTGQLDLAVHDIQKLDPMLLDKTSQEFKNFEKKISDAIKEAVKSSNTVDVDHVYVEVLFFSFTPPKTDGTRTKRDTTDYSGSYITAHYVIYTSESTLNVENMNTIFSQYTQQDCDEFCTFGNLLLFAGHPIMDDDTNQDKLCDLPQINHCDLSTTNCTSDNHQTLCKCKDGYIQSDVSLYSCIDIDECAENATKYCPELESCRNTIGSYVCECKKAQFWDDTSKQCVVDQCFKNPCKNDGLCSVLNNNQGFVCSCTYGWNGPVCDDEDTDARRMKIAVISVSAILGFCCLALFIIIIVLCRRQQRSRGKASGTGTYYSEIKPVPHQQKTSQRSISEMEENSQGPLYSRLNSERESGKRTAFHSPSAEGKKEGSATVYHNPAFEGDVARL